MWVENFPSEGDTVKVEFGQYTGLGTKIGIVERFFEEFVIINFGRRLIYLDRNTTFFVYSK